MKREPQTMTIMESYCRVTHHDRVLALSSVDKLFVIPSSYYSCCNNNGILVGSLKQSAALPLIRVSISTTRPCLNGCFVAEAINELDDESHTWKRAKKRVNEVPSFFGSIPSPGILVEISSLLGGLTY